MFGTYLLRELTNRRRQTAIIAIGMALAIALVIIVNAVAAGVRDAQATVLQSIYGVGTDITVTQTPTPPTAGATGTGGAGNRPNFNFGAGDGNTAGGTTALSGTRLIAARGAATLDSSALTTVQGIKNVAAATATLSLNNVTFSGTIPSRSQNSGANGGGGGGGGGGGSSFNVDTFSVEGVDVAGPTVGPLTAATLTSGRTFNSADVGQDVVIVDSTYATTASLALGGTLAIGGTNFTIIGIVGSSSSDSSTASNTYIPLDVAQTLSTETAKVSNIYVKAASSTDISQIQADIQAALPTATVNTQADLASTVSGSLSTASNLVTNLGTWLSVIVLAAAFLIAILFTISGVTRRTREFGTLKAIGWTNRRIVGQVAGESMVQGLIGGVIGVGVGLLGILVVNLVGPTLTGSASTGAARFARAATGVGGGEGGAGGGFGGAGGGFGGGGFGGGGGALGRAAGATTNITLQAPVTLTIILVAVGLAILGGLLAGAIGGWRAARLRPAEALRSVN
jgi:ABC-type antimicrobial peptide transport system permease subunit